MRDRSKKYLQKTGKDCLDIGNLVAWIIQEKHLKKKNSTLLSLKSFGIQNTTLQPGRTWSRTPLDLAIPLLPGQALVRF